MLYGLGYNATNGTVLLYAISSETGAASVIGTAGTFVDESGNPVRIGKNASTKFGMDFNPAADRIRIVTTDSISGASQNFRMNPNTGAFIDGDLGGNAGTVAGLNLDGYILGGTSSIGEVGYTNNSIQSSVTTLYTNLCK